MHHLCSLLAPLMAPVAVAAGGDIEVAVVDVTESPLADVQLAVFAGKTAPTPSSTPLAVGRTTAEGTFVFRGLEPGPVVMTVADDRASWPILDIDVHNKLAIGRRIVFEHLHEAPTVHVVLTQEFLDGIPSGGCGQFGPFIDDATL